MDKGDPGFRRGNRLIPAAAVARAGLPYPARYGWVFICRSRSAMTCMTWIAKYGVSCTSLVKRFC